MEQTIKLDKIPMVTIHADDYMIRIIQTSWDDTYSVINEDAHESDWCGHEFMSNVDIKDKYGIDIKRYFQ